jgi:hypothetical protein
LQLYVQSNLPDKARAHVQKMERMGMVVPAELKEMIGN